MPSNVDTASDIFCYYVLIVSKQDDKAKKANIINLFVEISKNQEIKMKTLQKTLIALAVGSLVSVGAQAAVTYGSTQVNRTLVLKSVNLT